MLQTRYTHTGQYSNVPDFGLMYYNARWYDPTIARFAQADTIVPEGVQGWDRYAYTVNNPIRYSDPSGHWQDEGCGTGGAGGGTGCTLPPAPADDEHGGGNDNSGDSSQNLNSIINGDYRRHDPSLSAVLGYCGGGQSLGTDILRCLATALQDAATLVDLVYAVPELGIMIVGTFTAGPGTIPEVVLGTDIVYNLSGGNALETGLSIGSTIFTGAAGLVDNGQLGEDFATSFTGTAGGTVIPDPIGDLAIDGYESGYNHALFNGVQVILGGGSILR